MYPLVLRERLDASSAARTRLTMSELERMQLRKGFGPNRPIKPKAFSESHVPRYRARVDTVIQNCSGRLSWRRRARPSTTLHEIQARPRQDRTRICICDTTVAL